MWWCVWEREGEKGKKERGENGAKERRCKREIKKISQNGKEKITLSFNGAPLGGGRERGKKREKKQERGENVGKYRRTSKKNEYKIEERQKLPRARRPGKTSLIHLHVHF